MYPATASPDISYRLPNADDPAIFSQARLDPSRRIYRGAVLGSKCGFRYRVPARLTRRMGAPARSKGSPTKILIGARNLFRNVPMMVDLYLFPTCVRATRTFRKTKVSKCLRYDLYRAFMVVNFDFHFSIFKTRRNITEFQSFFLPLVSFYLFSRTLRE